MYSLDQIERERRQPYFDKEYYGIYTGGIGNEFSTESIDLGIKIQYDPLSIISATLQDQVNADLLAFLKS
jgi:hypothetical protein